MYWEHSPCSVGKVYWHLGGTLTASPCQPGHVVSLLLAGLYEAQELQFRNCSDKASAGHVSEGKKPSTLLMTQGQRHVSFRRTRFLSHDKHRLYNVLHNKIVGNKGRAQAACRSTNGTNLQSDQYFCHMHMT